MKLPSILEKKFIITEDIIQSYAILSGDTNPIHLDKGAARQQGYPDRIVHGFLLLALHASLCTPFLTNGWMIENTKTKFIHPAYLHDTVYFSLKVIKETPQKLTSAILCTNHNNKTVFYGKMVFVNIK